MSKTSLPFFLILSACLEVPDEPGLVSSTSTSEQTSSWGNSSTSGPQVLTTTEDSTSGTSSSTTVEDSTSSSSSSTTGEDSATDSTSTGSSDMGVPCECVAGSPFCTNDCTWETRVIFVTSATITGDFSSPDLGEIDPDIFCNQSACDQDNCGYTALVMKDQLFFGVLDSFQGRYLLPSGEVVAEGPWDWTFEDLIRPIDEDVDGNLVTGKVWTGYDPDPVAANQFGYLCPGKLDPWSGQDGVSRVGLVGASGSPFWYDQEAQSCSSPAHVICVKTGG